MKAKFIDLIGLLAITLLALVTTDVAADITEVRVDDSECDQSETAIAVSPSDNRCLMAVWNDFDTTYSDDVVPGYGFSSDGGYSWTTHYILPPSCYSGWDPSCAFDRRRAYYCYAAKNPEAVPIYVSRTTNAGDSWDHSPVLDTSDTSIHDKPYIVVDNTGGSFDGRIHVAWQRIYPQAAIMYAYSSDSGVTWNRRKLYSYAKEKFPEAIVAPVPAVGPGGLVYVVWLHKFGSPPEETKPDSGVIRMCKLTNGGEGDTTIINKGC